MKHILTVDERLGITGKGVFVSPDVPTKIAESMKVGNYPALLKLPNGTTKETVASIQHEFRRYVTIEALQEAIENGMSGMICTFKALNKDEVPVGTEVWLLEGA